MAPHNRSNPDRNVSSPSNPDPLAAQIAAMASSLESMQQPFAALKNQAKKKRKLNSAFTHYDDDDDTGNYNRHYRPYNKITFPTYSTGDPRGWILKAEKYFRYYNVPEDEKVDVAVMHLEGDALDFYSRISTHQSIEFWDELVRALHKNFGHAEFQNPDEHLCSIKQTGTVQEYQQEFAKRSSRVTNWPEHCLLGVFLNGLNDELKADVRIHKPRTVYMALTIALEFESKADYRNRQVVRFRSLEKPKEDEFSLELSKLNSYDDVVGRVASHLRLDDPSKIRLTSHNCYSQQPKPQPIKYRGVERLSDMLALCNQTSDILYYEVLDIPLPELQGLKTLKVSFHHATKDEVVIHTIRLPKQSTVGDLLNDLKTKVELSHPDAELRLLEVFYHKIFKIFPLNEKIENINDQYWTLRAEEIPEEEKNLGPQDRLIHVYHFTKDSSQNQVQVQNFGEPFFLVIREGETLAEVKVRIQKKLQVSDEEFSKWKFVFLSLGRPTYLQDSDVVSTLFQRRDVYGAWEQYLGLEHSDNTSKRSYAANQNRHTFEKPVRIYN